MTTVGLIIKPSVSSAIELARDVQEWCQQHSIDLLFENRTAELLGIKGESFSKKELVLKADPIVSLGGDGTLIGIARYAGEKSPLFVGINFGNLGFLTELTPAQLLPTLKKVINKKVDSASRSLLLCTCEREGERVFQSQAVNDVVIQKGTRSKLLELDVFIDSVDLMRIRGDGLIFSTPTGSTAYSMAAGGSIVYPTLDITLITPICPHSLTYRPIILPAEMDLVVEIPEYDGEVFVTIDGQVSYKLLTRDRLLLRQSPNKIRFARSPRKDYFSILRTKLNWGTGNRNK